ncbi:MAG: 5'-3'-deoxyribonucleotidase [Candidatus Magasanikbacteria bacterium]
MIILVDLDNVLADFEKGFYQEWVRRYPNRDVVPLEKRETFYIYEDYPEEFKKDVEEIYKSPSFVEELPAVPKSIESVKKMSSIGHEVFICSSPFVSSLESFSEKVRWVEKHLGEGFVRRTILTKDKTLIKGDILIDDNPNVEGFKNPEWSHFIFDRPYNREIKSKERISWGDWEKTLKKFE